MLESAAELVGKANAAFVEENYSGAAELYSKAIEMSGGQASAELYVNRAHIMLKLGRHQDSKTDSLTAINLNPNDPKAHLRKGTACFHLEQYAEALDAFHTSCNLAGGSSDSSVEQWIAQTEEKLRLAGQQHKAAVAVKHDWYQTESQVIVSILAKNVDPSGVQVDYTSSAVTVKVKLADGSDYTLSLNLLHPIQAEQSTHSVMKTKVELKMKKGDGFRWNSLERTAVAAAAAANVKVHPIALEAAAAAAAALDPPVYPSSSAKKRDWDKIELAIKKEEEEEKPEGEAALNQLFQKIYADASEETRRAMNKSFQESGGTVLSTNWNEVGKSKVTAKPPDGMEFKKWDE